MSAAMDSDRPDILAVLEFLNQRSCGFEAWHDGVGYPLESVHSMNHATREALARSVVVRSWREVQLLAALDVNGVQKSLRQAFDSAGVARLEIGLALLRWEPSCLAEGERTELVCNALACARGGDGLDAALQAVQAWHPASVMDAMWKALDGRDATVAVHVAVMLYFLYGLATEPFDCEQRAVFLQFGSDDVVQRRDAQMELRQRIPHLHANPL